MNDWTPRDYYRALRNCYIAWVKQNPQLALFEPGGLDDSPLTAIETAGSTPTRETRTGTIVEPATGSTTAPTLAAYPHSRRVGALTPEDNAS